MKFSKELLLDDGSSVFSTCELLTDEKECLEISLCHHSSILEGTFEKETLQEMAQLIPMPFSEFKCELKKAFLIDSIDESANDSLFSLKTNDTACHLILKKYICADAIKILLGSFELKKSGTTSLHYGIFLEAIKKIISYQDETAENKRKLIRLEQELQTANNELRKLVDIKKTVEEDLYTKFSFILNEKKKKIRSLKDELNKVNRENSRKSETSQYECSTDEDAEKLENVDQDNELMDLSFNTLDNSQSDFFMPTKRKRAQK